jgi:putative flavoprotein involved in K+ transport
MDVIVVGAGQAGIAVSQRLAERAVEHVVLERGGIGDTWRTRRWDGFRMVSPNWANTLPGQPLAGPDGGFASAPRFVEALTRFAYRLRLPVIEQAPVMHARHERAGYVVDTPYATYRAPALVVASGFQWYPRLPAPAGSVPRDVLSVHSSEYRSPVGLPDGSVLVVGAAQSGMQIAWELARAGRRVLLCTSRVRRLPRRYRGRDMFEWWRDMGFLEHRTKDLTDPGVVDLALPVVSGLDGGHSLSLQLLARSGVTLLGHLESVAGSRLRLADDRDANVAYGDESAALFRRQVDEFLATAAPADEPDPADEPYPLPPAPTELDLADAGVGTVIWATGYRPHHPWLSVPWSAPGLHLVGKPWLIRRTSGTLYGIPGDAATVADAVTADGTAVGCSTPRQGATWRR